MAGALWAGAVNSGQRRRGFLVRALAALFRSVFQRSARVAIEAAPAG